MKIDRNWLPQEDEYLRSNHKVGDTTARGIADHLNRSVSSVRNRINTLKLHKTKRPLGYFFTKEDEDFLLKNYISKGSMSCSQHLGISTEQVRAKSRRMGMKKYSEPHLWTGEEEKWLIGNYPKLGTKDCSDFLKLEHKQVSHKITHLGIWESNKYTEEENSIIKEFYPKYGTVRCFELLGGKRTRKAIAAQAKLLGIKKELRVVKAGHRYCKTCDQEKLLEEFSENKNGPDGKTYRCKICFMDKANQKRKKDPILRWAKDTISSHKRSGYFVNFNERELIESLPSKTNCSYCQKQLKWDNTKVQKDSPSLDRMDNEKILLLDNVAIVCYECNALKSNRSLQEFLNFMNRLTPEIQKIIENKRHRDYGMSTKTALASARENEYV